MSSAEKRFRHVNTTTSLRSSSPENGISLAATDQASGVLVFSAAGCCETADVKSLTSAPFFFGWASSAKWSPPEAC